jgi:hypothetical protein
VAAAVAAISLLVAACGATGVTGPVGTDAPASPEPTLAPTTQHSAAPTAAIPAGQSGVPLASGPPAATADGFADPDGATLAGALGTWSWDDAGSDAPWIVPSSGGRIQPAGRIAVAFDPPGNPAEWTARWVLVEETGVGLPLEAAEGSGPIAFAAPADVGTWSLQVDARFAQGRGATWYWRVDVAP